MAAALRAWAPSVQAPVPSPSPAPPVPVGALLFSDDFARLEAWWDVKDRIADSGTWFDPANVSVHDGLLDIAAVKSSRGTTGWSGAWLSSVGKTFSGPYYAEAVAKVAAGPGTWSAPLWILDAPYGAKGIENDVCEQLGREAASWHCTLHAGSGSANESGTMLSAAAPLADAFHRYGCATYADHADYYLDGVKVLTKAAAVVPSWQFASTVSTVNVSLDMGGWGGPITVAPPARQLVQSVNVWALA